MNKTDAIFPLEKLNFSTDVVGGVAQGYNVYFAYTKPWIPSPAPKEKIKEKSTGDTYQRILLYMWMKQQSPSHTADWGMFQIVDKTNC